MHSALLAVVPSVSKQSGMVEHLLRDEVQKRPDVGVHAAVPQMHPALLRVMPFVSEQNEPVEQTLAEERQKRPVVDNVHNVLLQKHSPVLDVAPSVSRQFGAERQRQ